MRKSNTSKRAAPGRPLKEDEPLTAFVGVRMARRQKEKLDRLGGAPWVRKKIDQAKE